MKTNRVISILLGASLIGFFAGYYLLRIYDCDASISCYDLTTKAYALYYGMGALSAVHALLLFFPQAFNTWKKFAIWFVPLTTIMFLFQDDKGA